jgi:hypothetical protein
MRPVHQYHEMPNISLSPMINFTGRSIKLSSFFQRDSQGLNPSCSKTGAQHVIINQTDSKRIAINDDTRFLQVNPALIDNITFRTSHGEVDTRPYHDLRSIAGFAR